MFSTLFSLALLALPAVADFAVSSRPINQCEVTRISWEKTKGPYDVLIVDAAAPCGEPLADIGEVKDSFIEWKNTELLVGKTVQITIADADGEEAWSNNITVGAGSTDCLPQAASSSSSASSSTPTNSVAGGTSRTGTTKTSGPDASTDDGEIEIVGAANAGSNDIFKNAAFSAHQISFPVLALTAITAGFALAF